MNFLLNLLTVHVLFGLGGVYCTTSKNDENKDVMVRWVWTDGTRSTFDILWSCIAVIIVCTYKVIHLNLPGENEMNASWRVLLFWKRRLRKFKWMVFMALSPELLLSMALQDWLWCRDSVRKFGQVNLEARTRPSVLICKKPTTDIIETSIADNSTPIRQTTPSPLSLCA